MTKKIIALLLSLTLIFGIMPASLFTFTAAETPKFIKINGKYYEATIVADAPTDTPKIGGVDGTFKTEGGDGRVWTDKSVRTNTTGDVPSFDVTLSTVGQIYESEQAIAEQNRADVLLVLDVTSSMTGNDITISETETVSRVHAMVDAVNDALKIIFDTNPYNRVLILTYGGTSFTTALPLASYKANSDGKYLAITNYSNSTQNKTFTISTVSGLQKKNASGNYENFSATVNCTSGTFIQGGIQRGIEALMTAIKTEMGTSNTRTTVKTTPYILVLTDGRANQSSNNFTSTITTASSTDDRTPLTTARTILTAAYWVDQLNALYQNYNPLVSGANNTAIKTQYFSIGLSSSSVEGYNPAILAPALLLNEYNKGTASWNSTTATRVLKSGTGVEISGVKDGAVQISKTYADEVREELEKIATGDLAKYNPNNGDDFVYVSENYYYVAVSAQALQEAFNDLANSVKNETIRRFVPVVYNNLSNGVTMVDTLGNGMDIDITESTVFTATDNADVSYSLKYDSTRSNADGKKYVYSYTDTEEEVTMLLTIDKSGDNVVLTWDVPAVLLPLFNKVRDEEDKVSYTDALPLRLTYNVHPTQAALNAITTSTDTTFNFYSNTFVSGNGTAEGIYAPRQDNPHFYSYNEETKEYEPHSRFSNANLVSVAKENNLTGTSDYAGVAVFPADTDNNVDVTINYLGNNGKLTLTKVDTEYTPVSITLKKVDGTSTTKGALKGGVFTVTKSGETSGTDYTTGNDGTVEIKFTTPGTYTIVEKTAPTGYAVNTTVYTVTVSEGDFAAPVLKAGKYVSISALSIGSVKTGSPLADSSDYKDGSLTVEDASNKITISGSKTWDDDDYKGLTGYSRPTSITVTLVEVSSTGTETTVTGVTNPVTITTATTSSWEFKDVPEYRDGVKIKYAIKETAINGYSATYPADTFNITNSVVPGTDVINPISVTIKKVDSATGNPLAGAIYTLYTDKGAKVADLTATGTDGKATATFTTAAEVGKYVIKETTAPTGYKLSEETFEFEITKDLSGAQQDKDGKWQKVYDLKVTGIESTTITAEDDSTTFNLTIKKAWSDNSNNDGFRPDSVSFHIVRQIAGGDVEYLMNAAGTERAVYTINKPATASDTWKLTIEDLPAYQDGKKFTYSVIELKADGSEIGSTGTYNDKYGTPAYNFSATDNTITVTNTYAIATVTIEGEKIWRDTAATTRPASITIKLEGKVGTTTVVTKQVTVTATSNWKYKFENLNKYNDGNEITYTVSELTVDGYKTIIDGYDVINVELVNISGSKTWVEGDDFENNIADVRPTSIKVTLYQGTGTAKTIVDSKTVTSADNWSWDFGNLPKYDKDGDLITYTIEEDTVKGYTSVVNGYNITNTLNSTVKVDSVSFDIKKTDAKSTTGVGIPGAKFKYESAAKDDVVVTDKDGKYTFTFSEPTVVKITEDTAPTGYAINNTVYTVTVKQKITVVYNKDTNKYDMTKTLYIDSVKAGTETANEFDAAKSVINVADEPNVSKIKIQKTWEDGSDNDGFRPASVSFHLTRKIEGGTVEYIMNGTEKAVYTINKPATASDTWTLEIDNLPEYKDGKKYVYTVIELDSEGAEIAEKGTYNDKYGTPIYGKGTDGNATLVENTHTLETLVISGEKIWRDTSATTRPASIKIKLEGKVGTTTVVTKEATVTATSNWKYKFENLNKYNNGDEITYTVSELTVDGYKTIIDGYDVINVELVNISGSKTWVEGDDFENNIADVRPTSIKVTLYQGTGTAKTIVASKTVTADDNWSWNFGNLPKYDKDGGLITYTIEEDTVKGYTSVVDGYNITNTLNSTVTVNSVSFDIKKIDAKSTTGVGIPGAEFHYEWANEFAGDDAVETTDENGKITITLKEPAVVTISEVTAPTGYAINNTVYTVTVKQKITVVYNKDTNKYDMTKTLYIDSVKVGTETATEFDATNSVINVADEPNVSKIKIQKTWEDGSNNDGFRPDSVSFHLTRKIEGGTVEYVMNGTAKAVYTINKPATASDTWTLEIDNLPEYKDGKKYVYTVIELDSEGAEIAEKGTYNDKYGTPVYGKGTDGNATLVENTHTLETLVISGEKIWRDTDTTIRPAIITIKLEGKVGTNTVVKEETTASAETNWKYEFKDLNKYNNGNEITYTVSELTVDGYKTIIDGYNVINIELVDITGKKIWDEPEEYADLIADIRPESVTVSLYQINGTSKEKLKTVTVGDTDNWTWNFTGMPKYDKNGNLIKYIVEENSVPAGYIAIADETSYDITNKLNYTEIDDALKFKVKKVDANTTNNIGLYHATYTVQKVGEQPVDYLTNASGEFNFRFAEEGTYTIKEKAAPEGYTVSSVVYTIVVSRSSVPTLRYNSLTKQYEVVYELVIESVDTGRRPASDYNEKGASLTVADTPELISLSVKKVWNDDDNKDGIRPASIKVKLFRQVGENGAVTEVKDVVLTLDESNNWSTVIMNLDKYQDGTPITYTVNEILTDVVTGEDSEGTYSVEIIGDAENGYVITNTHTLDINTFALWSAITLSSVTALAVVFFARKKNEEN